MNSNEVDSKTNTRLNRIKFVSRIFRVSNGVIAGLGVLLAIWFVVAPEYLPDGLVQIAFSPHQAYISPFHIPLPVLFLGIIEFCLGGAGLFLLNLLFKYFERGIFFKTENIRCVKFLGPIVVGLWFTQTILELMAHQGLKGPGTVYPFLSLVFGSYQVHLTHIFGLLFGILLVFIAWIMDEGRKIQEEQALTI